MKKLKVPQRYKIRDKAKQLEWISVSLSVLIYILLIANNADLILSSMSFLILLYGIHITGQTKEYAKYKKLLRKQKREEPYFYIKRTTAYLLAGIVIGLFLSALMWGLS